MSSRNLTRQTSRGQPRGKPKKPKVDGAQNKLEKVAAQRVCEARAATVLALTRDERQDLLDRLLDSLAETAPSLGAVGSDELMLLLLVGHEFLARYYPDADTASLIVLDPHGTGERGPAVQISIPTPREKRKAGAR